MELGKISIDFEHYMWEDFSGKQGCDYIIDGIYGTGFRGGLDEKHKVICSYISKSGSKVIALDIPSGVTCDTGQVDENAVKAQMTITFHSMKPCHVLYPANEYCGETKVCDIGIDMKNININGENVFVITDTMAKENIPNKSPTLHKGTAGKVLLIGGKMGLGGAMVMAATGALRSGCGYLNIVLTQKLYEMFAPSLVSCTFTIVPERGDGGISEMAVEQIKQKLSWADSIIVGCGMGISSETKEIIRFIINNFHGEVIIDADGLNSIELDMLQHKKCNITITPHYKEMARLLHCEIEDVVNNRVNITKETAKKYGITVLLKSHQTIVATKNGDVFINNTGNGGMA
ncbi:MAG: NAD(P)H-hydrate dehydratase, partial [Oscillospiraceae bacterium]